MIQKRAKKNKKFLGVDYQDSTLLSGRIKN